jgi:hypothetical protein
LIKAYPIRRPAVRAGDAKAAPAAQSTKTEPATQEAEGTADLEKQSNKNISERLDRDTLVDEEDANGNQIGVEEV